VFITKFNSRLANLQSFPFHKLSSTVILMVLTSLIERSVTIFCLGYERDHEQQWRVTVMESTSRLAAHRDKWSTEVRSSHATGWEYGLIFAMCLQHKGCLLNRLFLFWSELYNILICWLYTEAKFWNMSVCWLTSVQLIGTGGPPLS
jgi:hypothetical protein